jgi:carbon storage regulator CsrA
MLVLTRKLGEETNIVLDKRTLEALLEMVDDRSPIVISEQMLEVRSGQVKIGYTADPRILIHRREIWDRIIAERKLTPIEHDPAA